MGVKKMKKNTNYALKRAAQCRELGDYRKAQEYLDVLIESDPENHMLWYEKSMLPIMQDDIESQSVAVKISEAPAARKEQLSTAMRF